MGSRTTYVPGTFSWVDLASSDVRAATAFYRLAVLESVSTGGARAAYTVARVGVDSVAGLFNMPAETGAGDVAPYWMSYVSVIDVDATVAQAKALAATIVDDPFDVGPVGRMSVLRDPQGGGGRALAARHARRRGPRQRPGLPLYERTDHDGPR